MRTLIVGAGAAGGTVGLALLDAGRDVTFLVRDTTRQRLRRSGLRTRPGDGSTQMTQVTALTRSELRDAFDVIVVAVRSESVRAAMMDITSAVGDTTIIIPVVNGLAHLQTMVAAYGSQRVCGAAAALAASMTDDGVLTHIRPGATLQIGALDAAADDRVRSVAATFAVDGLRTTVSDDIIAAMWSKFCFITSMTILTCLLRSTIGPIAHTRGGRDVAAAVLREVAGIAAASGHPLPDTAYADLRDQLTDTTSAFGPSMYRDLIAGRPVETDVLAELADHAHRHRFDTPLLRAALVALTLHSCTLTERPTAAWDRAGSHVQE